MRHAHARTHAHTHTHTQDTIIHALRWIRSRDPSNPAATGLGRRPQSHQDRPGDILHFIHSSLPKSWGGNFRQKSSLFSQSTRATIQMKATLLVFAMTASKVVYITTQPVIIYLLPSKSSAIDFQKV